MPDADAGGVRIHYRDTGGAGAPVVLIHGFPLDSTMWAQQEETLAPRYRVIMPDLMGFGRSDVPDDPSRYSIDAFAASVLAVMDAAGIGKAIVGGLSMGGYVTFALWRRARTRIGGLVLADTKAAADSDEIRATRSAQQERIEREGPASLADEMLQGPLLSDVTRDQKPDVVARAKEAMDHSAAGWIGALHALKERPDSTPTLSSIDVPTLITVGEHDAITPPAVARAMHEHIAGSRLVVVPDAGHLSNLESPGHFSGALVDFLGDVADGLTPAGNP